MGVTYLSISAVSTIFSFIGFQCWLHVYLERMTSDGMVVNKLSSFKNTSTAFELLLGSQMTIALVILVNVNLFMLLILCLKTLFFVELHSSEIRKLAERLINYIVYKGTFLPLVVPPTLFHGGVWSTWLVVLCSMKIFQALARDRLERLNASPSVTPWAYFRVYSALLLVFSSDLVWIKLCLALYLRENSSTFFLLFFEPLSIAFETLQAIVVHGFQLLDIWLHHSSGVSANCQISKLLDISGAGSLAEWKGILTRHLGFFLDLMTLFMALAHYLHIWWLHGMAFHLVDAVLFLNIRALLNAMSKRVKGYIKLRKALSTLHGALPDATSDELQTYDDECAICREPMAKAKKLSCTHLFHLACLRSWFDQGLTENYSCPTCRKPLFTGRPENVANPQVAEIANDEQLARQINAALNRPNVPGRTSSARNLTDQIPNPPETRIKVFDQFSQWNRVENSIANLEFEGLVKDIGSSVKLDVVKIDGPFELSVLGDDDRMSLTLPLEEPHVGLKRILVGEDVTVEVRGATQVIMLHNSNRQAVNSSIWREFDSFAPLSCPALLPVHILGPASVVAYRTQNPTSRLGTFFHARNTIELLPGKCYAKHAQKKRGSPMSLLTTKIALLEKVLNSFTSFKTDHGPSSSFLNVKLRASAIFRFQLELERDIPSNDTYWSTLAEWRTKPTVERVCLEVVARYEDNVLKPLLIKKVRPIVEVDSLSWSSLLSNMSFTKSPSVLLPQESLTLDVKW